MVPVIEPFVVLVETNAGMLPLPDAANPIPVFEFVQLIVAPVGVVEIVVAGIVVPAHSVRSGVGEIVGVGLTVMF
jgi:hypothetical protein